MICIEKIIKLSQRLNQKHESSKDIVEDFKRKVENEKELSSKKQKELEKIYELQVSSMNTINNSQKSKIKELENTIDLQHSTSILELGKKIRK